MDTPVLFQPRVFTKQLSTGSLSGVFVEALGQEVV